MFFAKGGLSGESCSFLFRFKPDVKRLILMISIVIILSAATEQCTASKDWLVKLNDPIEDAPNNYDIVYAYARHDSSKFFARIILNGTYSTEIHSGYGVRIYTDNATYMLGFCTATEYWGPHLLVSYDEGQSWETLQSSIEGKAYNNTIDLAVNLSDLQNFPWRIDFLSGIIFNPYAYEIKDETDEVRYPPIAYELLKAMDLEDEYLINCSLSGNLSSVAVFDNYSIFLPTKGPTFAVLSSGNASDIPGNPSDFISTDFGVEGVSGDTVTLTAYIDVPEGCNCLKVDFVFLSEEYPEWVGSPYNDFFYILLDGENIAFDPNGNIINVNNAFFDPNITPANSFDGQTPLLTTAHPVDPGVHRIDFQVGDAGDGIYDTAAFIDNLVISYEEPGQCIPVTKPNEPPIAKINITPSVIYEGSKVIFNASDSYDPDGIIVSYTWDFGDGENGTGITAEHTYIENGVYNVSLTVVDDKGATNTTIIDITVKNAPPIVDAGKDKVVIEGDNVSFYGTFEDPGLLDTHTIEWDFGDGTGAIGTLTPTHAYKTAGIYTVKLTVTDDDYGVGIDTLNVTVLPKIEVVSPNGGEILYGTTEIVWNTSTSVDLVDIEIFDGYAYKKIVSNISNTGLYMWNTSEIPDGSYKIKIIGKNVTYSLSNSDLSDDWFNIYNSFSVKVSASSTYSKTVEFEKEQYGITITNKEPFNDTFNIEVENIDGASIVELSENTVSIGAFDSKTILLNVTNDDTGIYRVRVVVTSQTHPNVKSDVTITTEVLPSFSVDIEAPEIRTSIGGNLTYKILITNHQKVGDEFLIDVSGISSDWYSVERTIRLSGGEIREIPLEIQVPEDAEFGTYDVTVSVTSTNNGKIREASKSLIVEEFSIYDLLPANGTHTGSRDVLITWRTPVNSTSSVFIREKSGEWVCFEGKPDIYHSVLVTNLSRNTWYEFYVMSNTSLASAISEIRSIYIENGIVFTQKYYNFTVERDYDQRVTIFVKNTDKKAHKLLVNLTNPYEDIIAGFVGEGSIDKIITLAPSEMKGLTLVVHAQDAQRENYTLLLNLTNLDEEEKIYDYAYLNLKVRIPNINFTIGEIYTDPLTLTKRFRITNSGDPITDLKVYATGDLEGNVTFQPVINHLYLRTGQSVEFNVTPILTEDFTGISGKIVAEGAGKNVSIDVDFTLPEGKSVYIGAGKFYHWKHAIPKISLSSEQMTPDTIILLISARFNITPAIFMINDVTKVNNRFLVDVTCLEAEEGAENETIVIRYLILPNLDVGNYTIDIKEKELNLTISRFNFELRQYGEIFNEEGLNAKVETYMGDEKNGTINLSYMPNLPVLPPKLSKYTVFWMNSTDNLYLLISVTNNELTKYNFNLTLYSDSNISIDPNFGYVSEINENSTVKFLFRINSSGVPIGIYNITYNITFTDNSSTLHSLIGKIPFGVYMLSMKIRSVNNTTLRLITPFNDTIDARFMESKLTANVTTTYLSISNLTLGHHPSNQVIPIITASVGILMYGYEICYQILFENKTIDTIDFDVAGSRLSAFIPFKLFPLTSPTISNYFKSEKGVKGSEVIKSTYYLVRSKEESDESEEEYVKEVVRVGAESISVIIRKVTGVGSIVTGLDIFNQACTGIELGLIMAGKKEEAKKLEDAVALTGTFVSGVHCGLFGIVCLLNPEPITKLGGCSLAALSCTGAATSGLYLLLDELSQTTYVSEGVLCFTDEYGRYWCKRSATDVCERVDGFKCYPSPTLSAIYGGSISIGYYPYNLVQVSSDELIVHYYGDEFVKEYDISFSNQLKLLYQPEDLYDSDKDEVPDIVEIQYGSDLYCMYDIPGLLVEFNMNDWYCTNRPVITTSYYLPSTIPETVSPEKNVEEAYLIIRFTLPWDRSTYRPHDVHILLNGHEIGNLTNTIPEGTYIFKFDSSLLNYAQKGAAKNTITLKTAHMNGGHYVVSSDIKVILKVKQIKMPVIASNKEEADAIVMNITGAMKNLPDLAIQPENIGIKGKPIANLPTTINITIYNLGTVNAHDVLVQVFDNDAKIDELVIPMLPAMDSENITITWIPASVGVHTISVKINSDKTIPELDYTNNEASKKVSVSAPDTTPPSFYNPQPSDGSKINNKYPKIRVGMSDDESGINVNSVEIFVDGEDVTSEAIITPTGISYTPLTPLEEGTIEVQVYAEDYAGNDKTFSWSFIIDATPPVSVTNLTAKDIGTTWILWDWSNPIDEDFDHVEIWVNGTWIANVKAPTHAYNLTGLQPNMTYEIAIRTVDDVGNVNESWVNASAKTLPIIDTIPPIITFAPPTPENNTVLTQKYVFVNITANEPLSEAVLNWNGVNWTMSKVTGRNWYYNVTGLTGGVYTFKIYACDVAGNWNVSEERTVIINREPIAIFTITPSPAIVGQLVIFNASASYDPDGHIVTYKWDFGDGNITITNQPITTHLYLLSGNFSVTLTIVDNYGAENSTSLIIQVTAVKNEPPIANADGPYTGIEGQPIKFNASASYDPEGMPLTYYWEFGDGNKTVTTQPTITHIYAQEGNYTVTLIVNDSVQNSTPSITYALINDTEPKANFTANITSGFAPLTVQFNDSSVSYDGIIAWEWDFNGDGIIDSNEQNPTYTYDEAGTYTVSLTVYEADGDSDTETKTDYISVSSADTIPPTIQEIVLDRQKVPPGSVIHVRVKASDNVGVVEVNADGISLTKTDEVWEGEITAPSTSGNYTITVTAIDEAGNEAQAEVGYSVVEPTGSIAVTTEPKPLVMNGTAILYIKLISTANFDDRVSVEITTEGIPAEYAADLSWFNATSFEVIVKEGETKLLPVEITTTAKGYHAFRTEAHSEGFNATSTDYGIIYVP